MKFVYVLVNGEKDFYTEQTLVSVYTLKKHNPDAYTVVLVDDNTDKTLTGNSARIREWVDEIIVVKTPENLSPMQRSRYIKTSMPRYIDDDFLYIDNDTVVRGDLSDIEKVDCEVGAVYNQHTEHWSITHWMLKNYRRQTGLADKDDVKITKYYNGGIILCRSTERARKFFETWHELWLKSSTELGFHKDQPDMWRANVLNDDIITPLPGIYNCMMIYPSKVKHFLLDSKILHYFSSTNNIILQLRLNDNNYLQNIRENGITEEVESYLDNILNYYIGDLELVNRSDIMEYYTPFNMMARSLSSRFPILNSIARLLYRCIGIKV